MKTRVIILMVALSLRLLTTKLSLIPANAHKCLTLCTRTAKRHKFDNSRLCPRSHRLLVLHFCEQLSVCQDTWIPKRANTKASKVDTMNADEDHFLFGRHLIVSYTRRIQKLGPTDVSVRRFFSGAWEHFGVFRTEFLI